MMFTRSFKMAIASIMSSKVRAVLTMLGIIIGIMSVIIIVSLINGFSTSMMSTFESMGIDQITATVSHPLYSRRLDADEIYEFVEENSDMISAVSPIVSTAATIKYGDTSLISIGTGASEDYADMMGLAVEYGTGLNYINVVNEEKVIILGSYLTAELFGNSMSAVGDYVKVNGERYLVIGVFEEQADSTEMSSDDMFVIPYTSAGNISRVSIPSTYIYVAIADVYDTMDLIEEYYIEKLESDDFHSISSMAEAMDEVNELTDMLTLVLVGIAGISLFVGGIGIMNIMLVSVTERTREIGIRKSLGGKRKDILTQFVIEAGVTSACGGVIGVVLGIVVAIIVGEVIGMSAAISIPSIIVSFVISSGIGIFFGYFPALKASKLNPIDALRYD
ncbi:MAG: ABC transporter permease [Clostridia bacterium]